MRAAWVLATAPCRLAGSTYSPEWRRGDSPISVVHMERENDGFVDRTQAGRVLARRVRELKLQPPVLVLALPRGGVPVAYEVANALHAPLDVLVVRKIGMPGRPELAIGAIASGGILVREPGGTGQDWLDAHFERLAQRELAEVERRERAYRGGLPPLDLRGGSVVLVDDGLATGATMVAAIRAARQAGADHVVVAAPVASDEAVARVRAEADQIAIVQTPRFLYAIGAWYEDFDQVEDAEVRHLLALARSAQSHALPPAKGAA
jgi:putative phosphoribosyl transferase